MIDERDQRLDNFLRQMQELNKSASSPTNLLESLSSPKIGRNDICLCGSGKKFKRCCISKSKNEYAEDPEFENFTISLKPLQGLEECDEADRLFRETAYENMQEEPQLYIKPLLQQIEKYPTHSSLYNHLFLCYTLSNRYWDAQEILFRTVDLFPDYLYGLVELASYYIRRGEYEKVLEVFKGARTLKQLYPEREIFHFTEVAAFYYVMGLYYLKIKDMQQSKICLSILENIDKECKQATTLRAKILQQIKGQKTSDFLENQRRQ